MLRKKYKTPPILAGYNFNSTEIKKARDSDSLLTMRLETSAMCNLACIYCNALTGKKLAEEISFMDIKRVVVEVKSLGGRSVVIIGGGEPTIYPRFKSLVEFINRQKMIPVVITNGLKLTQKMCRFLYKENASVLFKLDSLNGKTQDLLAAKKGTCRAIRRAVENLFLAGYNTSRNEILRCGASFVVTAVNYEEIPYVWRFCRENNIYPNLEEFIPRGRGLRNINRLFVNKKDMYKLKAELLKYDRQKYGYDWFVHAPLPGHGCLQPLYSVYIASTGYIRPCADIDIRFSNIKHEAISEVIKTPFFRRVRNIEKHLRGECFVCEHNNICIGCRGNAFSVGIKEGLNAYQAICREDPLCYKKQSKNNCYIMEATWA